MKLQILTSSLLAACLLTGCNDNNSPGNDRKASVQEAAGQLRLSSGQALSQAVVSLYDSQNELVATTTSDAEGRYQFTVNEMSYRLRADAVLSNGATLSQGLVFSLADPQGGQLPAIIFPDLSTAGLFVGGGSAQGDDIHIGTLPDNLNQLWAASFSPSESSTFPGAATTANEPFASGGYWWFAAADQDGNRLSQFNPPLSIQVVIDSQDLTSYQDVEPGNGQIDIGMVSYNPDTGLWQREANGYLVDESGASIPESSLSAIQSGSYSGSIRLAFAATHFSAYSAALFYRVGLPDFNDANAGSEQKHLRPEVAFNTGNNYSDFWLGDSASGENAPRQSDNSDDGLLSCGNESWVKVSYQTVPGINPSTVFLQVFQKSGALEDIDGEAPGNDYTTHFDGSDWRGKNIPVDNWSASYGPMRYAYLKLEDYLGTGHSQGYLRLQLTGSPLDPSNAGAASVYEGGEVEDYLDSCAYVLAVKVSGESNDSVSAKALQCSANEEDCRVRIGSGETVTFSAQRDGQAIAVDWSLPSGLSSVGSCTNSPTCQVQRSDNGTVMLAAKPRISANFPQQAEVLASYISGFGAVRDSSTQIDCDARSHEDSPTREDCTGHFSNGDTVSLNAEAAAGWEFSSWHPISCQEGNQQESQCSFNVVSNEHYYQQAYFVSSPILTINNSGGGRVLSEPAGIDCTANEGDSCSAKFPSASSVTLIASGETNKAFHSWTGLCANQQTARCTINISEDTSLGVNFGNAAALAITIDGEGQVSSQPSGIDCSEAGGSCEEDFLLDQSLSLSAVPAQGFIFSDWSAPCNGSGPSCTFSHDQARNIVAEFKRLYLLEVNVESPGGQISGTGSIIGCEQEEAGTDLCQDNYPDGTEISLLAEPQEGFEFVEWGGDCAFAASDSRCRFTIRANSLVSARFQETVRAHTLTLRLEGRGGSAGDYDERLTCDSSRSPCSQTYTQGSQVTLFAVPDNADDIVRWGGACNGTADNSDCQLTIDQAHEAVVSFIEGAGSDTATLTVNLSGNGEGMVSDGQFTMDCSSGPCSANYPKGSTVTLSATPMTTDDHFSGWTAPQSCAGSTANCAITLNEDMSATAEFNKL